MILDDALGEDADALVAGLGQRPLGGFDPLCFRQRRRLDEPAILLRLSGSGGIPQDGEGRHGQDKEQTGERIFHDDAARMLMIPMITNKAGARLIHEAKPGFKG